MLLVSASNPKPVLASPELLNSTPVPPAVLSLLSLLVGLGGGPAAKPARLPTQFQALVPTQTCSAFSSNFPSERAAPSVIFLHGRLK